MINPDELLFSVDENNNPIEPQLRSVSHTKRIWHRCCHVYIIDLSKHQVLCQKRSMFKDNNPGLWEPFFGGHLSPGQTYEESAIGEVGEELGLGIQTDNLLFIKEVANEKHPEFIGVFIYKWSGDIATLALEKDEVDEIKWFPIQDVISHVLTNQDKNWTYFGYDLDFLRSD